MTATMQKGYKGIGMEGSIARWYEKTTRKDLDEYRKTGERLRTMAPENGAVLEVAPGPGFLAVELARGGKVRVTGLDISKTFVDLATKNAAEAGVRAEFRQGNASEMPFADDSFDLLVCRAAFKNFTQPEKALREMRRVLRRGGKGVVIDLRRDASMDDVRRYVDGLGLGARDRWSTLFTFRFMLLKRAYAKAEMERMVQGVGFRQARVDVIGIGMEAWFEK
jgi:ubiquinone/menaquinone biosynthesis C-methylase UbiE